MKIERDSRIDRSTAVVETAVGGEIVLMLLESGKIFGLGETGSSVWRLLAKPLQVWQLVEALEVEYVASPGVIENDVLELLDQMANQGLIAVTESRELIA